MKLHVITNGNSTIGLGHLYRCRSIVDCFSDKNIDYQFILPVNSNHEVISQYHKIFLDLCVWDNPGLSSDYFSAIFKKNDIVLLDLIEEEFIKFRFLEEFGVFIYSLTLFKFRDENYFGNIAFYTSVNELCQKINNTLVLSGEKYLIIRKHILETSPLKGIRNQIPKILLSMGGADPMGLNSIIIDALDLIDQFSFECIIITGEANNSKHIIKKRVSHKDNYKYYDKVENIETIYKTIDFAIINGGNTRYELIYLNIPYICISMHDFQNKINQELVDKYGGINLGVYNKVSITTISLEIRRFIEEPGLRLDISRLMGKNNLGNGAQNIYNKIMNNYKYEKANS